MNHKTKTNVLARDAELTAFQHYVLDNRNETMKTIIDNFPFQHLDAVKWRADLVVIGYDAWRYPHRVPPIK